MSTVATSNEYRNPKISDLVYRSPETAEFTSRDWLELALAALDQAGSSAHDQDALRASVCAKLGL